MTDPFPPGLEDAEAKEMEAFLRGQTAQTAAAAAVPANGVTQYTAEEWALWAQQMAAANILPPGMGQVPGAMPATQVAATAAAAEGGASASKGGSTIPPPSATPLAVPATSLNEDGKPPIQRGGLIGEQKATVKIDESLENNWQNTDHKAALLAAETWEELQLQPKLLQGIQKLNFVRPSRIQAAALPYICPPQSRNMIGQAENGSGKTATFSLGLLANIDTTINCPQGMVLCPTRELAIQTEEVMSALGKYMDVKIIKILPDSDKVEKGKCEAHVVVGTPGKMKNMLQKRILNADKIKVFILDEADVMLDQDNMMGKDVALCRKLLPSKCQVLFFSATFSEKTRDFATAIVPNAAKITVENKDLAIGTILSFYQECKDINDKYEKLKEIYGHINVGQSIIFLNSRRTAFGLAQNMQKDGYAVSLICGSNAQGPEKVDPKIRDEVMDQFRRGLTKVLIATDVLARGIDVPAVTLVVNYEIPTEWEEGVRTVDRKADGATYLHRTGRTGRFGMRGIAVNLVDQREVPLMETIRDKYGLTITDLQDDFESLEKMLTKARK